MGAAPCGLQGAGSNVLLELLRPLRRAMHNHEHSHFVSRFVFPTTLQLLNPCNLRISIKLPSPAVQETPHGTAGHRRSAAGTRSLWREPQPESPPGSFAPGARLAASAWSHILDKPSRFSANFFRHVPIQSYPGIPAKDLTTFRINTYENSGERGAVVMSAGLALGHSISSAGGQPAVQSYSLSYHRQQPSLPGARHETGTILRFC